jgi:hypothetical protein
MGVRSPDRIALYEHRPSVETVADMWKAGWRLRSYCESCGIEREENLDAFIRLRGPGLVLWDKTGVCQRITGSGLACKGRLFFKACPRHGRGFEFMGKMPRALRPTSGPQSRGKGRYVDPSEIEPGEVTSARGPPPPPPEKP